MAKRKQRWRVQSNDDGGFDELVVHYGGKHGCLIHAEMMNDREIFVSVGDLAIWAHVDKAGRVVVTGTEDQSEQHKGDEGATMRSPVQGEGDG